MGSSGMGILRVSGLVGKVAAEIELWEGGGRMAPSRWPPDIWRQEVCVGVQGESFLLP